VAHGPVVRDHDLRVNRKMRRGALRSALTDAFASGKLAVVDELVFDEPKTKRAVEILDALGVRGRILLVLAEPTDTGAVEKSFRNLEGIRVVYAGGVGTYDVLLADRVVVTAAAVDALEGQRSSATASEPAEEGDGS
jgi:large subunit ribosomal protein L4